MSETTAAKFKKFLSGEIDEVSLDTIEIYLADAKDKIEDYGIGTTHTKFSYLQRLLAAHTMAVAGIVGVDATDESVGDVSISFANKKEGRRELTSYQILFRQELENILGMSRRCI